MSVWGVCLYQPCPKPKVNMMTLLPNLAFSSLSFFMMSSVMSDGVPSVRNRINFSTRKWTVSQEQNQLLYKKVDRQSGTESTSLQESGPSVRNRINFSTRKWTSQEQNQLLYKKVDRQSGTESTSLQESGPSVRNRINFSTRK